MAETFQAPTLPAPSSDRAPLLTLLARLAEQLDVPIGPEAVRDALVEAERERPGTWQATWAERLRDIAPRISLRARITHQSPAKLIEEGIHPFVVLEEGSGALRPLAVLGMRGPEVLLLGSEHTEPRWVAGSEARLRLGQEGRAVLLVEAARPLDIIGGGHGHTHATPWQRLFALLRAERGDMGVIAVFAAVVGALSLATPIAVQALVNTVAFGTLLQPVAVLALVLLAFLALSGLLTALQHHVVELLQRRLFVRVAADLAWRLPHTMGGELEALHGPTFLTRFLEVATTQKAVATLLLDGISLVLSVSIGMAVLAVYHPVLLGLDLLLLMALATIVFLLGRGAVESSVGESLAKHETAAWLQTLASSPTLFRGPRGLALALERTDALAQRYLDQRRRHWSVLLRQVVALLVLQAVANAAVLSVGGWLVIQRELTLGQLVASELIVSAVVAWFAKLGKQFETAYDLLAALDKLGHLVDLPIQPSGGERPDDTGRPASLHIEHATLKAGDRTLLSSLELTVGPGEHTAVVGGPGSGKSALASLLEGRATPRSGRVLLEGVPLPAWSRDALHARMHVVAGPSFFAGSLADQVRLGASELGQAEVREALEAAELGHLAGVMAGGLEAPIGAAGFPLSRGEQHQLVLARAMAQRPRLLVVDGTLDSLPLDLSRRLVARLTAREAPWTLLLLTHSTELASACRAFSLERGALAARG